MAFVPGAILCGVSAFTRSLRCICCALHKIAESPFLPLCQEQATYFTAAVAVNIFLNSRKIKLYHSQQQNAV